MNTSLKILRWENRISGELDDPGKLQKVMHDLNNIVLEDVIRSLGIGDKEYLCIKDLSVPVTLNLSRSVRSLARDWSVIFKSQLQQSRQKKDGNVVHYSSLHSAHIDCIEKILNGETRDCWAWQQCGLIPIQTQSDQSNVLLDKWCQQAVHRQQYQISIWNHLLRSPILNKAVHQLSHAQWQLNLRGLEQAFSCRFDVLRSVLSDCASEISDLILRTSNPLNPVVDFTRGRVIAPALNINLSEQSWRYLANKSPKVLSIIILMGLISKEPGLIRLPTSIIQQRIAQLVGVSSEQAYSRSQSKKINAILNENDSKPVGERSRRKQEHSVVQPPLSDSLIQSGTEVAQDTQKRVRNKNNVAPETTQSADDNRILTHLGGVFWLYNLFIKEPRPVEDLLSNPTLAHRGQDWVWLWMFWFFVCDGKSIDVNDPTFRLLGPVFAGIKSSEFAGDSASNKHAYQAQVAALFEQPPTQLEYQLLHRFAESSKTRFLHLVSPDEPRCFLEMIHRRAWITRWGPWMEVEYSLEQVDINVRRTCLDADPGFIVWLGMVVRFHYA